MPRSKKATKTETAKVEKPKKGSNSLVDRMQDDLENNQSYLNIILGGLIIIILAVLVFNWFNKTNGNIGPSQQTTQTANQDVSKDSLPGTYTVKEGDTLFTIAQNYYGDGYKYPEIVKENKLSDENIVEVGQKLTIPKVETQTAMASTTPSASPESSETPQPSAQNNQTATDTDSFGTGGAINQTIWGEKITTNTYKVMPGDWLSIIAGRAYGDIYAYEKIAKANNITDPNAIEVGMVLKLPR